MMHDDLWAAPQLKLEYALFHLTKMQQALESRTTAGDYAAMAESGAIVETDRRRSIYPHFDAFLAATRSIPQIIQCCFGAFRHQFTGYRAFRDLPLSRTRHCREYANVKISARFGVTYAAVPAKPVKLLETAHVEFPLPLIAGALEIEPHAQDFQIDGRPLFAECHEFLGRAQTLIIDARALAERIHGTNRLSSPPDSS
jgi:hypothetical protein